MAKFLDWSDDGRDRWTGIVAVRNGGRHLSVDGGSDDLASRRIGRNPRLGIGENDLATE